MENTQIISSSSFLIEHLPVDQEVLLLVPPIYDYRLPWASWHQPSGLLQLGSLLRTKKNRLTLIDCLYTNKKQIPRHKIATIDIEGYKFHKWHYGLPYSALKTQLQNTLTYKFPDTVLISSQNSIWWEATRDTISELKKYLPRSKVILGGAYPTVEPEHAAQNSGADIIVAGPIPEAGCLPSDISLYDSPPKFTGIYFYASRTVFEASKGLVPRPIAEVITEIEEKAKFGVREFLFFDEEILYEDIEAFGYLLEKIGKLNLDAHFVLPGNISPRTITKDLAQKMQQAQVTQVYLRCDLHFAFDTIHYSTPVSDYQKCIELLTNYGDFKLREGTIAAMLVVGLPYEDLEQVVERLIHLAHIVGSVTLVPFQYVPGLHKGVLFDRALAQNGSFSPEAFNSKLFPLARLSGKSLEEYMELVRLAALLNSKYRSKTFDFMGNGLTATMLRESIRSEGWNPFRNRVEIDTASEIIPVRLG
jgi:hypothetical protein